MTDSSNTVVVANGVVTATSNVAVANTANTGFLTSAEMMIKNDETLLKNSVSTVEHDVVANVESKVSVIEKLPTWLKGILVVGGLAVVYFLFRHFIG